MGSPQVYGFLTANFLLLTLLADFTAACYCLGYPIDLRAEFCKSDVVMRGKFRNADMVNDPPGDLTWARYYFEPIKAYKFIPMMRLTELYTQFLGTTCTYRHPFPFSEDEFIVTGVADGKVVVIDACRFIQPYANITEDERYNLEFSLYPAQCA